MSDKIPALKQALKRYWGFDDFLPLQKEAIDSVLSGRDSLVVLPTGGGKSLCFQAPASVMPGLAVVVSPLISLMKDQVDALRECGLPAARLDSSLTPAERRKVKDRIRSGELKLLYLSPERIISFGGLEELAGANISFAAVDEAHCVSMWGHDFRPEYRALGRLKEIRPGLAVHAYTATATERVRTDVIGALKLQDPRVLIGSFDRPNLVYRAARRGALLSQVEQVLKKRPGQSGIVYCIRRADADKMAADLNGRGYRALPYHAGLSDLDRKKNQEAFIREDADIIVATVAFGMGIDKSNVRFVIHAGMPKSLEHYQQESGRAGRDGLEAECLLLYSGGDFVIWRNVIEESEPSTAEVGLGKLGEIYRYCTGVTCRHQALVGYFGQQLPASGQEGCGACDVCLGGLDRQADALVIAQKILSCVLRLKECFGGDYTAQVLVGSKDARIEGNRHNELSTYGLLSEYPKTVVRDWMEQLCAQGYLTKTSEYNLLKVTPEGWQVLRGQAEPTLLKPAKRTRAEEARKRKEKRPVGAGDPALFDKLRQLRREIAREKDVAAFIVFGDRTLEDMADRKPKSIEELMEVHGVGRLKAEEYGERFLEAIREYGG